MSGAGWTMLWTSVSGRFRLTQLSAVNEEIAEFFYENKNHFIRCGIWIPKDL